MLEYKNRLIACALAGIIAVSGMPTTAIAKTMTISRERQQEASADDAMWVMPQVDVLVHHVGEAAWDADASFDDARAEAEAARVASARTISRNRNEAPVVGAEAALDAVRIAATEGLSMRYRLRERDAWQDAWVEDGAICTAADLVTGVAVEACGETADSADLWVSLSTSDGTSGVWSDWQLVREGETLEVAEGRYVTDVAVMILATGSAAPDPVERVAKEISDNAEAVVTIVTEMPVDGDVSAMPDQEAPVDTVTEEVTDASSDSNAVPVEDDGRVPETPIAEPETDVEAVPVLAAASEAPLVAAATISWARLAGQTRYDTMSSIVNTGFDSSETAVLACGQNFPDALAASGLAGALGCPILLTDGEYLSWQAESEIDRLGVEHVLIIGGTGVISPDVEDELTGLGVTCERIAGADRMATSLAVFERLAQASGSPAAAIVASGQSFADALSISPYAYATKTPILLTDATGRLTDAELATLAASTVDEVIIVGGTAVVSDEVEDQLADFSTSRLSGENRYATSAKIAQFEQSAGLGWEVPYVCTGKAFPDALAGSALAGADGSILLIADSLNDATIELLRTHADEIDHGVIFGGQNAFPFDDPLATQGENQGKNQGKNQGQTTGGDETADKLGYQNPTGFYQVSSKTVKISSQATAPFDYVTPSRIDVWATREDCIEAFIKRAEEYIGTPYIWNYACAPGVGVDCIGLVYQCAYACGMDLGSGTGDNDFNPWAHYITGHSGWHSHDANNFWDYGLAMHVSLEDRQRGDLISWPGHIAIYLGDDEMIHAYTPDTGVIYGTIWDLGTPRGCIRLFQ